MNEKNIIRLTENELKSIVESVILEKINEIGNTQAGNYMIGRHDAEIPNRKHFSNYNSNKNLDYNRRFAYNNGVGDQKELSKMVRNKNKFDSSETAKTINKIDRTFGDYKYYDVVDTLIDMVKTNTTCQKMLADKNYDGIIELFYKRHPHAKEQYKDCNYAHLYDYLTSYFSK